MAFLALPKDHKEIYEAIGYREKLDAVDEGIRRYANLHFFWPDYRAKNGCLWFLEADGVGMPNSSMR